MTAPEIRAYITGLICLRCLEAIAPGSPIDVNICGSCADDLRQEDEAERFAREPEPADREASEPAPTADIDFPW